MKNLTFRQLAKLSPNLPDQIFPTMRNLSDRGLFHTKRLHHRFRLLLWIASILVTAPLPGQTAAPDARLHYLARGTGQTTGVVANLTVCNAGPTRVETVVGDCFIPSAAGYQGYVIPGVYTIQVEPFQTVRIPLEGYCTNVHRPAVADGESMTDVSQWASWAASAPLPAPGWTPGQGFETLAAAPRGDPLALCFPGTGTAFLYRIDFNRHPREAARLLLHAVFAFGVAFDQLAQAGKIPPAPFGRSAASWRNEMVQQALWAFAARLEGRNYNQAVFAAQFAEGVEEQSNQRQQNFPDATRQQVEQQAATLWANIELVGVQAKLVPPGGVHSAGVFQETATGGAAATAAELADRLNRPATGEPEPPSGLIPTLLYLLDTASLAISDPSTHQDLLQTALRRWSAYLDQAIAGADPTAPDALPSLLRWLGLLGGEAGAALDQRARAQDVGILTGKLETCLRHMAISLKPDDPAYLSRWRRLKSWQTMPWYANYCRATDPLGRALADSPRQTAPGGSPSLNAPPLIGPQWKFLAPTFAAAVPHKFPWWIPATAAPVAGIGIYLLVRNERGGDQPPAPPVAAPDAITLPCNGSGTLNVLANDSGSGIAVTGVDAPAAAGISIGTGGNLLLANAGTTPFQFTYQITDKAGQTATATVAVSVNDLAPPVIACPPNLTLAGCETPPNPAISGQATAIDDCDPAPQLHFADAAGGQPCARIITRTWVAADASGKTAACVQTILLQDLTPPVLTCPPQLTVECGTENDLSVTGTAQAAENCGTVQPPVYADDLSQFSDCSGTIVRVWTVSDGCGNAASCPQQITIVPAPCTFTPALQLVPATCNNCNGAATVTVDPPGPYTYQWSNGAAGPSVDQLCPGAVTLIVGNGLGCRDTITALVPAVALLLTVTQTTQPSGPSAADGSIALLVQPPNAIPPFLILVNGLPAGTSNTPNITLVQLPVGKYQIQVIDNGGTGCASNVVTVELLFDGAPPPVGELEILPQTGLSAACFCTDYTVQDPEQQGVNATHPFPWYPWAPAVAIGVRVQLRKGWQAWAQVAMQQDWGPVRASKLAGGLRRYTGAGWWGRFFGEMGVGETQLLVNGLKSMQWHGGIGGGWRFRLPGRWRMEAHAQWEKIIAGRADRRGQAWRFYVTLVPPG